MKGKSVLDYFFFENPLDEPEKMPGQAENAIFLESWSKTQNSVKNRIFTPLSLSRMQNFPFLKGF